MSAIKRSTVSEMRPDFQVRPVIRLVVLGNLDRIAEIVWQRVHVYSWDRLFLSSTRLVLEFLFFLFPFGWISRTKVVFSCPLLKFQAGCRGEGLSVAFCETSECRCALSSY